MIWLVRGRLLPFHDERDGDFGDFTRECADIESILQDELGMLDDGSRLYGWVWTGGPQVVIRYYEAHLPRRGDKVPICAVTRLGDGQFRKRLESKPGMAILGFSVASAYVVESFQ